MSNYTKDNSSNQSTALYEKRKKVISITIILSVLSGILMSIGLEYSVFILIACGIATSLLFILSLIALFTRFSNEDIKNEQLIVFTLYFSFIVVFICWFFNWHYSRYITPDGSKQHLYSNCTSIANSKKVKEVSALEGFMYGHFKDCKICLKRVEQEKKIKEEQRRQERERKEAEEAEEHRIEMINFYETRLNQLKNNPNTEEIEDYYDEFKYGENYDPEDEDNYIDPSNR